MGSFTPLVEKQPITVQFNEGSEHHYRFIIKAVSEDRLVAIATTSPDNAGMNDIPVGTMVKATYIDKVAVYVFFTHVVAFNKITQTVTLGKPVNYKRIQRRNFVRLNTRLKVISNILDEDLNICEESFTAATIDISGGGLLIGCDVELKLGQVLEAVIYLNHEETVTAIGRVIRVIENSVFSRDRFSVAFEFTAIKEKDRDKIIRYILSQQRLLIKKGLL